MADKVKEVAVEEAEKIKSLTAQAARSGAYLYPIRVSSLFVYRPRLHTGKATRLRETYFQCTL